MEPATFFKCGFCEALVPSEAVHCCRDDLKVDLLGIDFVRVDDVRDALQGFLADAGIDLGRHNRAYAFAEMSRRVRDLVWELGE